jgi:2-dehydropantoate 2-reductase
MKLLILGAGATGGYFGARLIAAGADVSFLVRPGRAAVLRDKGLAVRSPFGDLDLPVKTVQRETLQAEYDLVLVACKAYDLNDALADVAPAIGDRTLVLPLLNGLRHLPLLDERLGRRRVLGGLCQIAATLDDQGTVVHLNRMHSMTIGARLPEQEPGVQAVAAVFGRAGFEFAVSDDIERDLWQKFVFLTSLAAMTCLMRGSVGEIMATRDGGALMNEMLDSCAAIAGSHGIALGSPWLEKTRALLTDRQSTLAASMLRDLEAGRRTEANHILGDMLERAEAAALPAALLRTAYCHLQTSEARKQRPR